MNNVLIIVDMQNDFTSGVLGNKECEAAVQKVVDVINNNEYDEVYLTKDTHHENYLKTQEGKNLPIEHCIEGTNGWLVREEIIEAVTNNTANLYCIRKSTFGSRHLAKKLRKKYKKDEKNTSITLVGVCTGICVISNAMLIKTALPEAKINVIEKACACVTPESHKTAIEAMKRCQINII